MWLAADAIKHHEQPLDTTATHAPFHVRGRDRLEPSTLGGVLVESFRGAEGHSDADALSHAVADAILGALCEGDLGVHFPDRDPQWKDVKDFRGAKERPLSKGDDAAATDRPPNRDGESRP